MAIQDVVRFLLPREDKFFDLVEKQGTLLHEAAKALAAFRTGGPPAEDITKRVQELEHEADAVLHDVEETLARTFVTPIDREDIQQLAQSLDDIIDKMNLTARSFSLYGVTEPSASMRKMMDILVETTLALSGALPNLRKHAYADIIEAQRKIKTLEKEGDTAFRDAVARLFRDPAISAKELLRDKEVLEDLEDAVDLCEDTAEFLAHLAIKNG